MNEYHFIYDEEYVLGAAFRIRRQRKVYPWFIAVKTVCYLGLAVLLALLVLVAAKSQTGQPAIALLLALVPCFFIFLLLLGPRIDYFLLRRSLKKSPFYGGQTEISVAESGVSVRTPKSNLTLSWAAFTQARRIKDGFLVSLEPGAIQWWPDSALALGTTTSVRDLLRANITSYDGRDA